MATKEFIGSGKGHQQFDSVTVTLKVDEALKHAYTRENGRFLTFVVSRRQNPDNYGRTHSAFVLVKDDQLSLAASTEPVEAPKKVRRKKDHLSPTA